MEVPLPPLFLFDKYATMISEETKLYIYTQTVKREAQTKWNVVYQWN